MGWLSYVHAKKGGTKEHMHTTILSQLNWNEFNAILFQVYDIKKVLNVDIEMFIH